RPYSSLAEQLANVGGDALLHRHEVPRISCRAQLAEVRFGKALVLALELRRKGDVLDPLLRREVGRREAWLAGCLAYGIDDRGCHVIEALRAPGAAVVDARDFRVLEKMQIDVRDVVDMHEIAALFAIGESV